MKGLHPVRDGKFLVWGPDGWHIPDPFAHWLVAAWNHVACRLFGHEDVMFHMYDSGEWSDRDCVYCCKPLSACTGAGICHAPRAGERWL
jgi:hypothetical protein